MSTFQNMRDEAEQKVLVQILSEIECNSFFTQRTLANELGIALGMINQYLKHCVTKGWIRVSHVSPRRIKYFITPEGFQEKSRMIAAYLSRSMTFFRDARAQIVLSFQSALDSNATTVGLVGKGDLADIALLVAQGSPLKVVLLQPGQDYTPFDMLMVTDIVEPQRIYNELADHVDAQKIITLDLLHINRTQAARATDEHSEVAA